MCPHIVHGYPTGAGIDTHLGGDHGDLIHGIGMRDSITTISIFILDFTIEPMCIEIPVGTIGIMVTMGGDLDR